jgi:hypothetical protein
LAITETELKAIAELAMMGLSSMMRRLKEDERGKA